MMKHEAAGMSRAVYHSFPYIAGYAERKDGAAIITRLMDTIQKTAAVIIEAIETRLLGECGESEETEEVAGISYAPPSYKSTLMNA